MAKQRERKHYSDSKVLLYLDEAEAIDFALPLTFALNEIACFVLF